MVEFDNRQWCWFYLPSRLPPSYVKWIARLARMDPRLLQVLRYARSGEYIYGQKPSAEVEIMCEEIAKNMGLDSRFVPSFLFLYGKLTDDTNRAANPYYHSRLSCTIVHGATGSTPSCEINALKRLLLAFVDCLYIYLPVHLIPQLLFNGRAFVERPLESFSRVLFSAGRSSAFLSTFIATIYASYVPLSLPYRRRRRIE